MATSASAQRVQTENLKLLEDVLFFQGGTGGGGDGERILIFLPTEKIEALEAKLDEKK